MSFRKLLTEFPKEQSEYRVWVTLGPTRKQMTHTDKAI